MPDRKKANNSLTALMQQVRNLTALKQFQEAAKLSF
jgi:hypothetical protein